MIHGLLADLTSYDGASFYLREKFQILRYDCTGHGKSPEATDIYHLADHVADLANLIQKNHLEKVVLLGMSNGARIAMEYARLFPDNVEAVIACDTFDIPTPMVKAKLGSWIAATETGGMELRFDIATPWIWGESAFNEKSDHILSYRSKPSVINEASAVFLMKGAMETTVNVSEILCPILFLVGKEDLLTPPFLHEAMQAKAKNSTLKIVEGGHACLIERPTIMDKQIIPWIEKTIS
jgi:3-oxoadipate enol-lactonase